MKLGHALFGITFLSIVALAGQATAEADNSNHFVVGVNSGVPLPSAGEQWFGMPVIKSLPAVSAIVLNAADASPLVAAKIQADPRVRYVEAETHVSFLLPNEEAADAPGPGVDLEFVPDDSRYAAQYGPGQVRAPLAWDTTTGNQTTAVCIVDTGVRYTHEDLATNWGGGSDVVTGDNDPMDGHGHGTHVAGIAAATINNGLGIAGMGNVQLYGVRVLDDSGRGYHTDVAEGILWCADNTPVHTVISLSLGGSGAQVMADAVHYAVTERGRLVVAAAGNSGPCLDCVGYPAAYEEAIAVGCTTSQEAICWFSSRGPDVDVSAPGYAVHSSYRTNDTAYATFSGTSMSTPHVSGALALAWQELGSLTNTQLRERMEATVQDLGYQGDDDDFGFGELDLKCLFDDNRTCTTAILPPAPPLFDNITACLEPGPDRYGYTCTVQNRTWEPIASGATVVPLENNASAAIPLGFAFEFYGQTYDQAYIGANGWLAFERSSFQANPDIPTAQIAPFSNRLVYWYSGEVSHKTVGDAPNREFWVEWFDVMDHYGRRYSFQVILHEDGSDIDLAYDEIRRPKGYMTAGITNQTGTTSLAFARGQPAFHDLLVRFSPPVGAHPGAPATVAASSGPLAKQVTVSWAPPASGPTPTGYRVYVAGHGSYPFLSLTLGNVTSAVIPAQDDRGVKVWVTAHNSVGEGPFSLPATARTLRAPSLARDLVATPEAGTRNVMLTWTAPGDSGGLPLLYYRVYRGPSPQQLWIIGTTATPTFTDANAALFAPNYYAVSAVTAADEGAATSLTCALGGIPLAVPPDCSALPMQMRESCRSTDADRYGYRCESRSYRYEELPVGSNQVTRADGSTMIPIGFDFSFYGATHQDVYVDPEGILFFGLPFDGYSRQIGDATPPNNFILVEDNLDVSQGGRVHYAVLGNEPQRRLVVEWRDVTYWGSWDTIHLQVVLEETTNAIEIRIGRASPYSTTTVGIESPTGITGSTYVEDAALFGLRTVRFVPPLPEHADPLYDPPPQDACETPGPDEFGYTCSVVPWSFTDISTTGQGLPVGYEYMFGYIHEFGFEFDYYGRSFNRVVLEDDAQFIFDSVWMPFIGKAPMEIFPEPEFPNGQIVAYTGTLEHHWKGHVWFQTLGTAPYRMSIVQYEDAVPGSGLGLADFQVVFYETTNDIEIHYRQMDSDGSIVAAGMEDRNGMHGLLYKRGLFDMDQTSVRFAYPELGGCDEWEDVFGYECEFPPFEFTDISQIGIPVDMEPNGLVGPVPLGFPYDHYGTPYAQAWIGGNGFLTFTEPPEGWYGTYDIPSPDILDNFVAGWLNAYQYWDGGTVHYQTIVSDGRPAFVVQFTDVPHWSNATNRATFQIVLEAGTNNARVNVLRSPEVYDFHMVGIEDAYGADGILYGSRLQGATNLSVLFRHPVVGDGCEVPGPDASGYTCRSVPYTFLDIRETGTVLPLGLDDAQAIPIGFDFDYYGQRYDEIIVGSNGLLAVPPSPDAWLWSAYHPIPGWKGPNGVLAGFYEDLEPQVGQVRYQVLGAAPARVLVVQWTDVNHWYSFYPDGNATFQILLLEGSNAIQMNYLHAGNNGFPHTIAIEDPKGVEGVRFRHAPMSLNRMSLLFAAPPAPRQEVAACELPIDAGGYVCQVIEHEWVDIASTGTAVAVPYDGLSSAVPMGFSMPFYGTCYNKAYLSRHGYLSFDPTQASSWSSGQRIPDPTAPNNLVAAYWAYSSGNPTVKVAVHGAAPMRSMVIQWNDYSYYAPRLEFQIILHEGGDIEVQLHDVGPNPSQNYVTGIERADGLAGSVYRYGSFGAVERGVRFSPTAPVCSIADTMDVEGLVQSIAEGLPGIPPPPLVGLAVVAGSGIRLRTDPEFMRGWISRVHRRA